MPVSQNTGQGEDGVKLKGYKMKTTQLPQPCRLSAIKSKRKCKGCGQLTRDHPHGLTGKYCTGIPPSTEHVEVPPTEPTERDLETLQGQHAALQKAKLAKEVQEMQPHSLLLCLGSTNH
ncbi:hypothetical protein Bbelb_074710 [Branchiostoma belcheri]|nr:hypothetical protein Bbelb_074710 [Branchiostoma belcheri]